VEEDNRAFPHLSYLKDKLECYMLVKKTHMFVREKLRPLLNKSGRGHEWRRITGPFPISHISRTT
jgi:hypothetical protein